MATISVSLPDPMKDWVEVQVRTGGYGDAGDYLRGLIRRDQERVDRVAELQRLITEGLDSGISDRSMADVLDMARRRAEHVEPAHVIAAAEFRDLRTFLGDEGHHGERLR